MNRDCANWTKCCLKCQANKISRHTLSPIANFELPSQRFEHIHINLVSLPASRGFTQCLPIIHRFTSFPQAIAIENSTAETTARALVTDWISLFGVPLKITSDVGRQFESDLFHQLTQIFGSKHLKTMPYHPQSNGLFERLHRQLKSAILCHGPSWYDVLPVVFLGLRAAWKEDINATSAELVFDEPIRLPGEFLHPSSSDSSAPKLISTLRQHFHAQTSRHRQNPVFIFKDLATTTHVLVKHNHIRQLFATSHDGPYPVVKRREKYCTVNVRRRNTSISVDCLKPVYFLTEDLDHQQAQAVYNHRRALLLHL